MLLSLSKKRERERERERKKTVHSEIHDIKTKQKTTTHISPSFTITVVIVKCCYIIMTAVCQHQEYCCWTNP